MAPSRSPLGAQLTPIFTQDLITPGIFYFGLVDNLNPNSVESWWIVLRCPEESLPLPFRESKEPSSRAFPFFVLGQNRFVWLERSALYLLHPSQKIAFAKTNIGAEFCDYYDLAVGVAKGTPLVYFDRDIAEARHRFLADRAAIMDRARLPSTQPRSVARGCSAQSLFISEAENMETSESGQDEDVPQKKRKRQVKPVAAMMDGVMASKMNTSIRGGNSASVLPQPSQHQEVTTTDLLSSLVSSTPKLSARQQHPRQEFSFPIHNSRMPKPVFRQQPLDQTLAVRTRTTATPFEEPKVAIKTEDEADQFEYGRQIKMTDKITVILGSGRPYPTARTAIEKSPILAGQIQYDVKAGNYVMHPELSDAEPADVLAMLDFMQTGEYNPRACPRPFASDKKALKGKTEAWQYSEELIRAGRLYKLAKALHVKGMVEHLLEKIKSTEYKQYSLMSRMELCVLIFGEPGDHTQKSRDDMQKWIIKAVGDKFKQICLSKMEREYFWDVLEPKTSKRKVVRDIFAYCATEYHNTQGGITVDLTFDE